MIRSAWQRLMGKDMLWRATQALERVETQNRVAIAMARAAVTSGLRRLDPLDPDTWEFSGFSQHGEDGVVDHLCNHLVQPNEYFVEIGAGDGTQNCTAWLAFVRQYGGLMVEGDEIQIARARTGLQDLNWGVQFVAMYVDPQNVGRLLKRCPYRDPDVFSLDIDSIDYHVAKAVFDAGVRPKVFIVEYNAAFGPDQPITVPLQPGFSRFQVHPSGLYYGVGIAAWRALFGRQGYEFLTTDRSGTNAFFIDPQAFPPGFPGPVKRVEFRMNYSDQNGANRPNPDGGGELVVRRLDWRSQFQMIEGMKFEHVNGA